MYYLNEITINGGIPFLLDNEILRLRDRPNTPQRLWDFFHDACAPEYCTNLLSVHRGPGKSFSFKAQDVDAHLDFLALCVVFNVSGSMTVCVNVDKMPSRRYVFDGDGLSVKSLTAHDYGGMIETPAGTWQYAQSGLTFPTRNSLAHNLLINKMPTLAAISKPKYAAVYNWIAEAHAREFV